jgi:hypothetical protein
MYTRLIYAFKFLLGIIGALLRFTGVVVGGVTMFLVLSPLFGYLAYSDRPGPGWHGSFPAMSWTNFWSNALLMLETGLFLAIFFGFPGLICVLLIRLAEIVTRNQWIIRSVAALLGGVTAAYWMLGAGWYIAAGEALSWTALVLGIIAGATVIPRKPVAGPQSSRRVWI